MWKAIIIEGTKKRMICAAGCKERVEQILKELKLPADTKIEICTYEDDLSIEKLENEYVN